jgi:hypothetical protein
MRWTVESVKRATSGFGDSMKTIGFEIMATRHTEMGQHSLLVVVPLHMSHPLIGDVVTTEISWSSLDETISTMLSQEDIDELEEARLQEANGS